MDSYNYDSMYSNPISFDFMDEFDPNCEMFTFDLQDTACYLPPLDVPSGPPLLASILDEHFNVCSLEPADDHDMLIDSEISTPIDDSNLPADELQLIVDRDSPSVHLPPLTDSVIISIPKQGFAFLNTHPSLQLGCNTPTSSRESECHVPRMIKPDPYDSPQPAFWQPDGFYRHTPRVYAASFDAEADAALLRSYLSPMGLPARPETLKPKEQSSFLAMVVEHAHFNLNWMQMRIRVAVQKLFGMKESNAKSRICKIIKAATGSHESLKRSFTTANLRSVPIVNASTFTTLNANAFTNLNASTFTTVNANSFTNVNANTFTSVNANLDVDEITDEQADGPPLKKQRTDA